MPRIKTGHELFDSISNLYEGSFILILDEGHFESILFLNSLFSSLSNNNLPVAITFYDIPTKFRQVRIDAKSLSDLSIFIGQLREKIGRGIIIHHYLPQLLVKEGESAILKMLEHWVTTIYGKPFLEILTLPRNTFPTFERTLQALLPGSINLDISKIEGQYIRKFMISRSCDARYHGVEFPYLVKDDRLLIKFLDEFTDRLPLTKDEKLEKKRAYLRERMDSLKVTIGKTELGRMPPHEYLLLTQISGMTFNDIRTIFPDKFDEILEKIAKWTVNGIVEIEEIKKLEVKPVKDLSAVAKIALTLPKQFAIRFMGNPPRKVPIETLLGSRKMVEVILNTYFPDKKPPFEDIAAAEKFFHEIAGRITAAERIKAVGQDPRAKMDTTLMPKIVAMTLYMGFGLGCRVEKKHEGTYEVKVKDCFACEGVKSDKPICNMISGTLTGALSQAFKERIECHEVKCKALGDQECMFIISKI